MIILLTRAVILFFFAVTMMRVMGKRQISQLQPYELVISIMIAELASTPMEDTSLPIAYSVLPMLMLVVLHSALSVAGLKSQRLRALICGKPSIFVKKGVIQEAELRRNCFDLNDLLEELRASGIQNPADVCTAVLETSGKMSVFPHAKNRPLSPLDMSIPVAYEGIPLTLVLDGEIQYENLTIGGLDVNWLNKTLGSFGYRAAGDVFLASLDTQGMLFTQGHGSRPRIKIARVLEAPEVSF